MAGASVVASLAFALPAAAADTTVTIAEGATQTTAVTASPTAPDTYTINILGTLRAGLGSNVTNISVQGSGSGAVVINNDGRLQGRFNFPTATGPITLHNNTGAFPQTSGWHTGGVTTLGAGADLFDNGAEGVIATSNATTFNFGAGDDTFTNAGRLIVERTGTSGTLTLTGLETFENSGLILLGSQFINKGDTGLRTDNVPDDALIAQGVNFIGSGDSRIGMDVRLGATEQADCSVLTAADCVDFTGGSTAGVTQIIVRDTALLAAGDFNEGITLIVGSSAPEHFILSPESDRYAGHTSHGPAVQKGLVAYHLAYDSEAEQHQLVGILADEAFQGATFASSLQETWRATAGTWLTRQADLRASPGGLQTSNGLWARIGTGLGEREVASSFTLGDTTYDYDVTHTQKISHLVFGGDILGAEAQDSAWLVGAMVGFVRTDVEYDATPTEVVYSGFTGGLYGSYVAGPLFVDAVFNANLLHMEAEVPNMDLGSDVPLTQDVKSLGGQIEAGWRVDVGSGVFIEPLAGVSYVTTMFEREDASDGDESFDFGDSYTSLRAGAGLRVGLESALLGMTAAYSLTGRYWNESEANNVTTVFVNDGAVSTTLNDDFGGAFSEVNGSINLYGDEGAVSGFVNLGGKFGDDYQAMDAAIGVRLRW